MKKIIICLLSAATFIQCSQDQSLETINQEADLQYIQQLDLSNQYAKAAFDESSEGLYAGTIATKDLSFHEKIFININNDKHINAQIANINAKHFFKGEKLDAENYIFQGNLGSFKVTIQDTEVAVTDAIILNKEANITVFKSTSSKQLMPSLGTFSSNAGLSGTWDYVWSQSGFNFVSSNLIINKTGGATFTPTIPQATYQRTCNFIINAVQWDFDFIAVANSSQILNLPFSYNVQAGQGGSSSFTCPTQPTVLTATQNTWSWNGVTGLVNIDESSLPVFQN